MTIEDWDRTLLGLTPEEYARRARAARVRELLSAVATFIGGAAVMALLLALAWLLAAMPE